MHFDSPGSRGLCIEKHNTPPRNACTVNDATSGWHMTVEEI